MHMHAQSDYLSTEVFETYIRDMVDIFLQKTTMLPDVRSAELFRIASLVQPEHAQMDTTVLFIGMCDLLYPVADYQKIASSSEINIMMQVASSFAKTLICERQDSNAAYAFMTIMRERLFAIYLLDKSYYRSMCNGFYQGTKEQPDLSFANENHPEEDVGFVVVPELIAHWVINTAAGKERFPAQNRYQSMLADAARFQIISGKKNRFLPWLSRRQGTLLYKTVIHRSDAMPVDAEGIISSVWAGLAFAAARISRDNAAMISSAQRVIAIDTQNLILPKEDKPLFLYIMIAVLVLAFALGVWLWSLRTLYGILYFAAWPFAIYYAFCVPDVIKKAIRGTPVLLDLPYEEREALGLRLIDRAGL